MITSHGARSSRSFVVRTAAQVGCVLLFAVGFLIGCASNISKGYLLKADEGVMITRVHSNVSLAAYVYMKERDVPPLELRLSTPEDLKVVAIESGKAYFQRFENFPAASKYLFPLYFTIEPGTITYIGDYFIDWWGGFFSGDAKVRLVDKEEETLREAKAKFPWLFERLPYRKSLPAIETDKDFQEPHELRQLKDDIRKKREKSKDVQ